MHILYIVPYVPSLIRVRSYNFLRTLARLGHDITVATLWSDADELDALAQLAAGGMRIVSSRLTRNQVLGNIARALPSRQPLQARYSWQPTLADAIREELSAHRYDVVHVEHLRGAEYGLHARRVLRQTGQNTPVVWDSVDSISHLFSQAAHQSRSIKGRLMAALELGRTRRSEKVLPAQFDRVVVSSVIDRDAFLELSEASAALAERFAVVSNGVDTQYFAPAQERLERPTLVVSGKMSYHANVSMVLRLVESVMPSVWQHRPDVRLWIVGKDPPAEIRTLDPTYGSQTNHNRENTRVLVTGTVPDIRPYLQQATLSVVPLPYGAGTQFKVLEAMACATPVLATPQAVTGLTAVAQHDVAVAREETFAEQIVRLLEQPEKLRQLGANGRAYVTRCHSLDAVTSELLDNYAIAQQIHAGHGEHADASSIGLQSVGHVLT